MKTSLIAACALSLIALLPSTGAAAVLCDGDCEIQGGSLGFIPPVQALTDGSTVNWVPNDGNTHANIDAGVSDPCIFAAFNPTSSTPVTFDIVGATLTATSPNETNVPVTLTCTNAVALPGGAFAIQYFCVLHPVLMKGVLVVVPDAV